MADHQIVGLCIDLLEGRSDRLSPLVERLQSTGNPVWTKIPSQPSDELELMRVAMISMPEAICWSLACDFIEHVLPTWHALYPDDHRPTDAIHSRREWLLGKGSLDTLAGGRELSLRMIVDASGVLSAMNVAAGVMACVTSTRPYYDAVWSAARYAVSAVGAFAVESDPLPDSRRRGEAAEDQWQMKHLRTRLQELLLQ
jgi:hypothetical protein